MSKERARAGLVCRDGFTAETFSVEQFQQLAARLGLSVDLIEVDQSALFAIMKI